MTGIGHKIRLALLIGISFAAFGQEAGAVLKDFGPLNFAGFPSWYRDNNGLALQQCVVNTPSPAVPGSSMCSTTMIANAAQVPPFDPTLPVTFPPIPPNNFNWPGEAFYFQATADPAFAVAGSTATLVEFGLESTFNVGDPVPGEQTVFARVRISLIGMPVSGTYTVRHPYGVETLHIDTADVKSGKMTRDIGFTGVIFQGALQGNIGPYLSWTADPTYPGGIAPAGTNPDGSITTTDGETFIGDPNVPHTVTGSPFGYNKIRIEGPGEADLDGAGNNFVETELFVVEGRKWTTPIPSPLVIDRSTYARNALVGQVDVFANTSPVSNVPPALSSLSVSGSGITTTPLATATPTNGSFVGYLSSPTGLLDPGVLPVDVTVTNTADVPASQATKAVVDEVKVTEATFVPSSGTLRIKAASSDQHTPRNLSAGSFGALTDGTLNVADVTVPPATVSVTSSGGGLASLPVSVRENYQIAANSIGNGTLFPNGSVNVPPGSSQSFSFTPAPGERVVNVVVDGTPLGPLTGYIFSDVSANHTIAVTFAP